MADELDIPEDVQRIIRRYVRAAYERGRKKGHAEGHEAGRKSVMDGLAAVAQLNGSYKKLALPDGQVDKSFTPDLIVKAAQHAPKGGATLNGKDFRGGQFIPAEDMEQATPEEKADLKAKQDTHGKAPAERSKPREPRLGGVADTHKRVKEMLDSGALHTAEGVHELATSIQSHTVAELKQLKHALGVRASGPKAELARKIAERARGYDKHDLHQHRNERVTVDEAHAKVQARLKDGTLATPEGVRELAQFVERGLTVKEVAELKKRLGLKASGPKYEMSRRIVERAKAKWDEEEESTNMASLGMGQGSTPDTGPRTREDHQATLAKLDAAGTSKEKRFQPRWGTPEEAAAREEASAKAAAEERAAKGLPAEPPTPPKVAPSSPEQAGFTGTAANGVEYRDGVPVKKQEEPPAGGDSYPALDPHHVSVNHGTMPDPRGEAVKNVPQSDVDAVMQAAHELDVAGDNTVTIDALIAKTGFSPEKMAHVLQAGRVRGDLSIKSDEGYEGRTVKTTYGERDAPGSREQLGHVSPGRNRHGNNLGGFVGDKPLYPDLPGNRGDTPAANPVANDPIELDFGGEPEPAPAKAKGKGKTAPKAKPTADPAVQELIDSAANNHGVDNADNVTPEQVRKHIAKAGKPGSPERLSAERRAADNMVSMWREAVEVNPGKYTPEQVAAFEQHMKDVLPHMEQHGKVGETVPFDPAVHASKVGMSTGTPVTVKRAGWVVPEEGHPNGGHRPLKADVEPTGKQSGANESAGKRGWRTR